MIVNSAQSTKACVNFQADVETDEVYAQMTLQPLTPVSFYSSTTHSFFYFIFYFCNERVLTKMCL
jgi:hypothetical protein